MTMLNIQYTRGRELVGLYFIVRNIPGVLGEIAKKLGNANVNIVALNMSSLVEWGDQVPVYIACDFTNSSVEVDTLIEELKIYR